MRSIQPIAVFADGEADGKFLYRVRFLDEAGKEIEHVFTLTSENGIDGVNYTNEFWQRTKTDPFVKQLCESIISFHQSRQR
jgi:hypothetical protein